MSLLNVLVIVQFSITFVLNGVKADAKGALTEDPVSPTFDGNHTGVILNNPFFPHNNYTEKDLTDMLNKVSSKFTKIFIPSSNTVFTEKLLPVVAHHNQEPNNTTVEVILEFSIPNDPSKVTDAIRNATELSNSVVRPGTVTTLVMTLKSFEDPNINNILSSSLFTNTSPQKLETGITMDTNDCIDNVPTETIKLLEKLDHVFLVRNYPNTGETGDTAEAFNNITNEFHDCVNSVKKAINKDIAFKLITQWKGDKKYLVNFCEKGNKWAVKENTSIFFKNAFEEGLHTIGGFWNVEKNNAGNFIFTEHKKAGDLKPRTTTTTSPPPPPSPINLAGKANSNHGPTIIVGVISMLIILCLGGLLLKEKLKNRKYNKYNPSEQGMTTRV